MVPTRAGAVCVSLLIVSSYKFSGEHRCAKESHSESTSFWGIRCVGGLAAVPFTALILLNTPGQVGLGV